MTTSRLTLALQGSDSLPADGRILVFGPRAGADLSALPMSRVQIVQGFLPDHDALAARGFAASPTAGGIYSAGVVVLPRARAEARAMVAKASDCVLRGGPVWIDGQKTDGIDTMLKDVRARVATSAPLAKAHGKIFRFDAPGDATFDDWQAMLSEPTPGVVTAPGVFSADKIDRGSQVLADALPAKLSGRIADLGAGWGWLSAQILARDGVDELHMIEADHLSLDCARRNISDPRAQFHWADVTSFKPDHRFDAIVTNPPFHTGRSAEPALGAAFITAAARMLTPSGTLWLVANRHLPYESVFAAAFRELTEIGSDSGFKVLCAARPISRPQSLARAAR